MICAKEHECSKRYYSVNLEANNFKMKIQMCEEIQVKQNTQTEVGKCLKKETKSN